LDGTITRVDAGGDRVVGAALPAGTAPWQMAVGSSGNLLVLTTELRTRSKLTYVAPSAGVWRARPLVLEPGAQPLFLAGDGKRYAAVAYGLPLPGKQDVDPGNPGCRLALVDLRTGAIARAHTPCADQESITGLALETTAAGTAAYLGLSRWYEEKGRRRRDRYGQVVALDAVTGIAW